MSALFRPAGTLTDGADPVRITAEQALWTYAGLDVLALGPGEVRPLELDGVEAAVVPLEGACTVDTGGETFDLAGRESVFTGIPDVAYLGLGSEVEIGSAGGGRFAVATSTAEDRRASFVVRAEGVTVELRGAGQASRQVNGLLSADVDGPQRLIVVEVLTPAGNWSSYPPHKHDEWTDDEVPLEEIYYFRISGDNGFGIHRTYTTGSYGELDGDIDETVTVRDGDLFLIPRGYHGPCVAAPGYDMYYLNVMAGPDPQRRWLICNDPAHDWVRDTWQGVDVDPRLPMTGT